MASGIAVHSERAETARFDRSLYASVYATFAESGDLLSARSFAARVLPASCTCHVRVFKGTATSDKVKAGHVADLCNGSTCCFVAPALKEVSVARDQSVRNRIVRYLAEHGAVEDSSGKATSVLKKAIDYEGTDAGFTQVVAAMAKAGLLARQIKGKRTYRISNSGSGAESQAVVGVETPMPGRSTTTNLRRRCSLRSRALRRLPPTPRNRRRGRGRRLEQLEAANTSLQRDVARANAEAEAVAAERDILQNQLEAAAAQSLAPDRPSPRASPPPEPSGPRTSGPGRAVAARPTSSSSPAARHDVRAGHLRYSGDARHGIVGVVDILAIAIVSRARALLCARMSSPDDGHGRGK